MKCKICKEKSNEIFKHQVLKKYPIKYFRCSKCGFIQTEKPFWLEEAYTNSITKQDTGLKDRNLYYATITPGIINSFFSKKGNFLDYAGGNGLFTSLMHKKGFNFYWADVYTKNKYAKKFVYHSQPIDGVTCFECFEHFENPINEINKILKISKNILFSTALVPTETPNINWEYYGFDHGQHIALYSKATLTYLAVKYNLNLFSNGNLHLFTKKSIPPAAFYFIVNISKFINKLITLSSFIEKKTYDIPKVN